VKLTDGKPNHEAIAKRKLVPGEALFFMVLTDPGAGENVEVEAHLMETGTTRTMLDVEDFGPQDQVDDLAQRLVARVCRQYPVLHASVTKTRRKSASLAVGELHGATPGMPLCFYQEETIQTGAETLKHYRRIPARGRVHKTKATESTCRVVCIQGGKCLKPPCIARAR